MEDTSMSRPADRNNRRMLFVTKFSVSPVTALGVQTSFLMAPFPGSINLYWATPELYRNSASRIRLENPLIARAGRLQGDRRAARVARAMGLSWWRDDVLRPSHARRVERLRSRVSIAYLAPIDLQDAARMRLLAEVLQRPYVLHLWDSFSGPLLENPDLTWLVRNAAKVFVVSDALAEDVHTLDVEAETLLFSRPASSLTASPPDSGPVRIALLGTIDPYMDGVVTLDEAIGRLAEEGIEVEPVFVGSERAVAQVNRRLSRPLVATGFLSDIDRDRVLAGCHLGFLPGPAADPAADMRSRYSVPSRSMDFLAIGLPAVGVLHPRSAARRFYEHLGVDDLVAQRGPESLAAEIRRLADAGTWRVERERVRAAWDRLQVRDPGEQLLRAVDRLP